MYLRRTPLAIAISMATLASAVHADDAGNEDTYDHVPYYEYIYFTEEEFSQFEGTEHHAWLGEYTNGKYLTVDQSQDGLDDPLFLVVGTQLESAYDRQNPTEIIAENRSAIEIAEGTWNEAIIVNTAEISASGIVDYPDFGEELALAIAIDAAHVVGVTATDSDAARLDGLPVFVNGDERVFLYNSGVIRADELGIALISDEIDADDNIISAPAVVEGSLINHAPTDGGGIIESTGANGAPYSYAFGMVNAELRGNIVNGLDSDEGKATIRGRDGAIYILDGSVLTGDIVNRGLISGTDAIRIEESEFNGRIINHAGGEIHALNGTAIDIRGTTGNIVIDQRGTLSAQRYLDSAGLETEPGQAMFLQGQNIHARLSNGSVIGDIAFEGATVTLAGGEYEGTISNRGGVFVVEGIHHIDGSYEQDTDGTLRFSSQELSSLSAERITLADGSTLMFGNGEAYEAVERLAVLQADRLEVDLDTLNLQTASGLYRISQVELSDDGTQLLVTYAGLNGEEIARRAIDTSNASGAKASQLLGLGIALNRVLANGSEGAQALFGIINGTGQERLDELLPNSSGAVAGGTSSASQASSNAVAVRTRGVAAGDALAQQGIWIRGLYGEIDQRTQDGVQGFDSDTRGFVLGGDLELHNGSVFGLAWSRTSSDVDGKNGLTRGEIDFDQLTAYAGRAYGNWLFDAQLSYGWGDNDTSRRVLGNTARASFDSEQVSVMAAAAHEFRIDDATRLTPRLSATYANLELDAYEESGAGALNLRQDDQRIERFELGLEGELAHLMPLGNLMLEPRLTLGVHHDFQGKARSSVTSFSFAPEETFIVDGPKPDSTRYNAGVGIDLFSEGGFTTSVDYDYGWTSSMSSHGGSLQVRYDF